MYTKIQPWCVSDEWQLRDSVLPLEERERESESEWERECVSVCDWVRAREKKRSVDRIWRERVNEWVEWMKQRTIDRAAKKLYKLKISLLFIVVIVVFRSTFSMKIGLTDRCVWVRDREWFWNLLTHYTNTNQIKSYGVWLMAHWNSWDSFQIVKSPNSHDIYSWTMASGKHGFKYRKV